MIATVSGQEPPTHRSVRALRLYVYVHTATPPSMATLSQQESLAFSGPVLSLTAALIPPTCHTPEPPATENNPSVSSTASRTCPPTAPPPPTHTILSLRHRVLAAGLLGGKQLIPSLANTRGLTQTHSPTDLAHGCAVMGNTC